MTDSQLEMFQIPVTEPEQPANPEPETIEQKFARFHAANPHVIVLLTGLAKAVPCGRTVSIRDLFGQLRYQIATQSDVPEPKLNNNYTALYARLITDANPELSTKLVTRARAHERDKK